MEDRLCGLVARVPGCGLRGPWFDSRRCQIIVAVGLEGSPLSLVRITEKLLEREVAAPVQKIEFNDRGGGGYHAKHISKSWH
jgi:hypothetical protein